MQIDGDMDQEEFENSCKLKIFQFFDKIEVSRQSFDREGKDRVRKERKWNDEENFIEMTNQNVEINVFVRYKRFT